MSLPPASRETTRNSEGFDGALSAFTRLYANLEAAGFRGWEFDDALASPVVRSLVGGNLLARRVAIQVVRRSVVNLRPLLATPRLESTKARGFVARGLLGAYLATGEERWLLAATEQLEWLLAHTASGYAGASWGNDFDFASRGGFYPAGLPTVVWSTLIGEAFQSAFEITGEPRYLATLHDIALFVYEALDRHEDESGVCIGYAPGVMNLVHNSNLFGALSLARSASRGGPPEYRELAERSIAWTISRQEADGSWPYGVGESYAWCDNFHTAYCLDTLAELRGLSPDGGVAQEALDRGLAFWLANFFLADGTPKYYRDSVYPIDIQCCSQAIESLWKWSVASPIAAEKAPLVTEWTLAHMRKPNGSFRFRRTRFGVHNELESLHWGETTMLSALGQALVRQSGRAPEGGERP